MSIGYIYVAIIKSFYYTILDEHIIVTGKITWEKKPSVTPFKYAHWFQTENWMKLNEMESKKVL